MPNLGEVIRLADIQMVEKTPSLIAPGWIKGRILAKRLNGDEMSGLTVAEQAKTNGDFLRVIATGCMGCRHLTRNAAEVAYPVGSKNGVHCLGVGMDVPVQLPGKVEMGNMQMKPGPGNNVQIVILYHGDPPPNIVYSEDTDIATALQNAPCEATCAFPAGGK